MTGPVQVLVVGLDAPSFSGEVMAELTNLREQGVVRLVDVMLVERGVDGTFETFETLETPPGWDPGLGRIAGRSSAGRATRPTARRGRSQTRFPRAGPPRSP